MLGKIKLRHSHGPSTHRTFGTPRSLCFQASLLQDFSFLILDPQIYSSPIDSKNLVSRPISVYKSSVFDPVIFKQQAMAPSRKKKVQKERRARSKSPPIRRQSIRTPEEVTSRQTRSSNTLSLQDHRIPVDCLLPSCDATTVHQHYDNLQFFNPHPANEIQYPGCVSSHRVTSLQPDVANGGPALRGQEIFKPENSDDDETVQEQDENGQTSGTGDVETDDQEEQIEPRTLIVTFRVGAPEEENDAQESVALADLPKEQQDVMILDRAAPEEYTTMDEGISDLTPGDPITSRRTLDFVEDLVNPMQAIPMDIDYETIANAWDSRDVQKQREVSPLMASRGLHNVFDKWLVPMIPEQASETLPWDIESFSTPLHNSLSQGDGNRELPSDMMRPAPDPYMLQFQVRIEDEDDFEAVFGHSGKD